MLSPSTLEDILSQRDEIEELINNQRYNISNKKENCIAKTTKVEPPFKEIKSQLALLLQVCRERLASLDQNQRHNQTQEEEDDITPLSQEYLDSASYGNGMYYNDKNAPSALGMSALLSDIGSKDSWNGYGSVGATAAGTGTGINDSFERDRTLNDTYDALTRSGNHMGMVLDSLNNEYNDMARLCPPKVAQSFGTILESLAGLAESVPESAQPELQDLALLMRVTMHEFSH